MFPETSPGNISQLLCAQVYSLPYHFHNNGGEDTTILPQIHDITTRN